MKNTSCRSRPGPNRSAASAWRCTAQLMGAESRSPPYRVRNPTRGRDSAFGITTQPWRASEIKDLGKSSESARPVTPNIGYNTGR